MSKQTLNERVLKAAEYLPKNLAPTPEKGAESLFEILEILGIENSEMGFELLMSEHCKLGYARDLFVNKKGIPIVKFSKIWAVLREGAKPEEQEGIPTTIKIETIGQLGDKELLQKYGPDCSSDVEEELKKRSKGRNTIVFESDRKKINVDLSLKFLKQTRLGITPPEWSDGKNHYAVYPVGKWPNTSYDICPITGSVLVDDYCSQLGVSWKDVGLTCRQFLSIAVHEGIHFSALDIRDMIDIAKEKGIEELRKLFPKISLKFDDCLSNDKLPTLKTTIDEHRNESPNKPFEPQVYYRREE